MRARRLTTLIAVVTLPAIAGLILLLGNRSAAAAQARWAPTVSTPTTTPLAARAGTVNPKQFLEDLYAYQAAPVAPACSRGR
jgi:hypothetical protein